MFRRAGRWLIEWYVLSARPAKIVDDVKIDLERTEKPQRPGFCMILLTE